MSRRLLKFGGGSVTSFFAIGRSSTLFESATVLTRASSSFACRALDVLHSVYRHRGYLLFQFETEFAQHGEDCGEVIEARGRRVA
jgi:hypothetical protein